MDWTQIGYALGWFASVVLFALWRLEHHLRMNAIENKQRVKQRAVQLWLRLNAIIEAYDDREWGYDTYEKGLNEAIDAARELIPDKETSDE